MNDEQNSAEATFEAATNSITFEKDGTDKPKMQRSDYENKFHKYVGAVNDVVDAILTDNTRYHLECEEEGKQLAITMIPRVPIVIGGRVGVVVRYGKFTFTEAE